MRPLRARAGARTGCRRSPRRARLVGAPAGPRPLPPASPRWPTRATRSALLGAARLAAGRPVVRRAGAAGARRARARGTTLWDAVARRRRCSARRPTPTPRRLAAFRAWFAAERERAPRLRARRAARARVAAHRLRPARARAAARRAAAGQRPQAAAPGRRLRGAPRARRARLHRPRHRRARGRRARARRARRPRRPRRRAADDDPRRQGPRVPASSCVADLGRRGNLSPPDLLVDGDRVGLRLVGLDGAERDRAGLRRASRPSAARADEAEERRVMHVAMTRAEERLILSGAARLGDNWPHAGAGRGADQLDRRRRSCPASAALDPRRPGARPRPRAHRRSTSPASDVLRLEAPAPVAPGEQLALALNGGRARSPRRRPAAAPAEPRRGARRRRPPRSATRRSRATRSAPTASTSSAAWGCPSRSRPRTCATPTRPAPASTCACAARSSHALLEASTCAPARAPPDADAVARRRRGPRGRAHRRPTWPTCGRWSPPSPAAPLRERLARGARRAPRARPSPSRSADGPLLNGFVDVIAEEADGAALIVDYKSDRVGDADLEALVEAALRVQRRIYALAALRAGAPAVEVAHVFLERPGEPAVARYEQADAETLEAELRDAAAPLLAGDLPGRRGRRTAGCARRARAARACAPTRPSSPTARSA